MPDIATVLKAEIARLARKEIKREIAALRKAVADHRSEMVELRHRVKNLEGEVRRHGRGLRDQGTVSEAVSEPSLRFSSKGFATLRQRLGLTAADMAKLIGASALSVYKWEHGKAKPRAKYLPKIAALRAKGKREAQKLLGASE